MAKILGQDASRTQRSTRERFWYVPYCLDETGRKRYEIRKTKMTIFP